MWGRIEGAAPSGTWNKGKRMSKTDRQYLSMPREDLPLFLAVAVYFPPPKYATLIWLAVVTSMRISEVVRLEGEGICLEGAPP